MEIADPIMLGSGMLHSMSSSMFSHCTTPDAKGMLKSKPRARFGNTSKSVATSVMPQPLLTNHNPVISTMGMTSACLSISAKVPCLHLSGAVAFYAALVAKLNGKV